MQLPRPTPSGPRFARRALAAAAAAAVLGATAGVAPAWAHVTASSENAVRGGYATVTFSVPNESENNSATTELTIALPDVAAARTETVPGWTAKLDRDPTAGTVRSVTWTAAADSGIPVDEFGLFRIAMALPDTDTVTFPAVQSYADGTRVAWDEDPLPDGSEPDHPAPRLTLAAGPAAHTGHHSIEVEAAPAATAGATDNTARWLGGAALLAGAAAIGIALTRRRA